MKSMKIAPDARASRELSIICPSCDERQPIVNDRTMVLGTTKPNLRVLACGAMALFTPDGKPWFNFEAHRAPLIVLPGGAS